MKVSKAINDSVIRNKMMETLNIKNNENFVQGSNQSFYMIVEDDEGVQRLGEVRFIAGANDEMSAQEKLEVKVMEWENKKAKAEAAKKAREEKAKRDKERREKKAKEKAEAEELEELEDEEE